MAKSKPRYKRIAQLKTIEDFQEHLSSLDIDLPFKPELDAPDQTPLGGIFTLSAGKVIGNRFCILPMEGWDGTTDGRPTEFTKRRWHNFAISGAKLLWGCEAVAVRHDGKANPNQLLISNENLDAFKDLHQNIIRDHEKAFKSSSDLLVGLQLTHSGRFSRPDPGGKSRPKILYHHSLLDQKFGISPDYPVMSDAEIDQLVEDFVVAAQLASEAGFHFVDIKHCHGYLGHEFLSARNRKGKYGGDLGHRLYFLRSIVNGIKATSNIPIGVRLSAFDWKPFKPGEDGVGIPEGSAKPYLEAFGCDSTGLSPELMEVIELFRCLDELGIELVCITAGSPYYNPHIQRPALFPPSDGYLPPEDPLVGVARQVHFTGRIKQMFPHMAIVGSAYSYLQEWFPYVAEAVIEREMADFVGLGRMVLSYPDMPADILNGRSLERKRICRTFSDCTTAPRHGLVSGCYPLDPYYKKLPEAEELNDVKRNLVS